MRRGLSTPHNDAMTNSQPQPAPVPERRQADAVPQGSRLSRRRDQAHDTMLARLLDDDGVSRLQVAAFNSSI